MALALVSLYNGDRGQAHTYEACTMLLRYMDLLFRDPASFILVFATFLATSGVALLIAITVHEGSHAAVAYRLGDSTGKRLGRLSLNPLRHLDPMGTLMLLLVGFGWGKPVPVNPHFLRYGARGMSMVAAAGPVSNVITAAVFALPVRMGLVPWHSPFAFRGLLQGEGPGGLLADLLGFVIFFNIILAVFNLIPLFPLDGSKVAVGILPSSMASTIARWEAAGPAILMIVIMVDWVTNLNLIWGVLQPMADVVGLLVLGHTL